MNKLSSKHIYRVLGLMAVVSLVLAACGGSGGTSSGSGGGGGASVARVSGTVTAGNARAGLDVEQRVFDSTGAIVAIGNFLIPSVQAATSIDGIPVLVKCDGVVVGSGFTHDGGKFDLPLQVEKAVSCVAIFGDPPELEVTFGMNPEMEVEIEVSLLGNGDLKLDKVKQKGGDDGIQIDVKDDEDSSDEDEDSSGNVKVTICHKPGTPAEKTMSLPESARPGHLGHGDAEGACP